MRDNPYTDTAKEANTFLREFDEGVDSNELVWHRDRKDRHVKILKGSGWQLQFDNKLPINLRENQTVFIPKNTYHRLHKGTSKLVVEITEDDAS